MAKVVMLNAEKINYDHQLNMDVLGKDIDIYDNSTPQQIVQRAEGAKVLITKELPMPADLIAALPQSVVAICEAGTGYNNIDLQAAKKRGIVVCNIPAYSSQRVAQTAIMMILCLSSQVQKQVRMLQRGDYSNFTNYLSCSHTEVNQRVLGVIGAGGIGREVIKIARAMDMQVLVYTRTPREDEEGVHYTTLNEVLQKSDYLTLHCPLNQNTYHMIDQKALQKMKPTACIINTSRGALIDEKALIAALQNHTIAGAGLDVQEQEPPQNDNPLYQMDNVLLTPHLGWKGLQTRQRLIDWLAENVQSVLNGNPKNRVI